MIRKSANTVSALAVARRGKGATLIDLVITVLIIGILAATAAPRFATAMAKLRAEAVARRIASDLNYARRAAMQTSRQTTVTFRSAPAGYTMTNVEHPAHPSQTYAVDIVDVDSAVTLTSYNFDGGASLTFNPYGRPLVGGVALANGSVVVNSSGYLFTVVVDSATGEASIP